MSGAFPSGCSDDLPSQRVCHGQDSSSSYRTLIHWCEFIICCYIISYSSANDLLIVPFVYFWHLVSAGRPSIPTTHSASHRSKATHRVETESPFGACCPNSPSFIVHCRCRDSREPPGATSPLGKAVSHVPPRRPRRPPPALPAALRLLPLPPPPPPAPLRPPLLVSPSPQPAAARAKPDFSGTWVLDLSKSDFGMMPAPASR